jgi:hypothetical protein
MERRGISLEKKQWTNPTTGKIETIEYVPNPIKVIPPVDERQKQINKLAGISLYRTGRREPLTIDDKIKYYKSRESRLKSETL